MTGNYLDYPLIKFSENPADWWTIRNAVTGVQVFGGIGSGKSSGSGKTLAYSFLKNGFGGIVLTGKVDETETWLEYAKSLGRLNDVVLFGANRTVREGDEYRHLRNKGYMFNPLDYMGRSGESGKTENIVSLFISLIKIGDRISGTGGGSGSDPFWDRALQRLMKAAIDLLKLADVGKDEGDNRFGLTVPNIARVVRDAPLKGEEIADDNFTMECLANACEATFILGDEQTKRTFEVVDSYFKQEFATMPEKTRGSILETFYAFSNPFRSGMLADFFSFDTSPEILPENTFDGKIIILDFPVKEFLQVGIYAQAIYKKMWQQAVEKRTVRSDTKPVFMWVDEAQFFLSEDDMLFQTTARSSRACSVMISQNISNYYATMGGDNVEARVNSLLGNLSTKIFHANNDYVTNEWAAKTIGQTFQTKTNVSIGESDSTSLSRALHYQVEPQEFTLLKNGGEFNNFQVEGVMTVSGKRWSNGTNFLRTQFYQRDVDVLKK
jgi:type IV secretory pathway TraG/TraD family ATPase VirD4